MSSAGQPEPGIHADSGAVAQRYRALIHRYTLRLVGDASIADDLTQETFLRVHQIAASSSASRNPAALSLNAVISLTKAPATDECIHSGSRSVLMSEGQGRPRFGRVPFRVRDGQRQTTTHNSEGGNDVLRRNMGRLDRTLRFIAGVALVPIGLFALGGWQGSLIGILVAAFAVLPLVTSLTGFCPGYVPFRISTVGTERKPG